MVQPLEFEKSVMDVEAKIAELKHLSEENNTDMQDDIARLQGKAEKQLRIKKIEKRELENKILKKHNLTMKAKLAYMRKEARRLDHH